MALNQYVSAFFVFVAVLFCIIALATPRWLYADGQDSDEGSGPFVIRSGGETYHLQLCEIKDSDNNKIGEVTGKQCDNLKAAQAFGVIAVLSYGIALILILVLICTKKTGLGYPIAIFTILGGVAGLICMGVVADRLKKDAEDANPGADFKFGYSFGLMIVAWVVALIDGIIMCIATYQAGGKQ